jgi:hypothetical protein
VKSSSLQILESAQLLPTQARAILQAMEQELEAHYDDFVHRGELHSLELKLLGMELKLAGQMGELRTEMGHLRTELKSQGARYLLWMFSMFTAFSGLVVAVLRR